MKTIMALGLLLLSAPAAWSAAPALEDLVMPVHVTWFDMYRDGGTLGGRIVDAQGSMLEFCLDGRMQCVKPEPGQQPVPNKLKAFYIGGTHPSNPKARPLAIGGAKEQRLLSLLSSWVETVLPESEFGEILAQVRSCSTVQQEKKIAEAHSWSTEQIRALKVDRMIRARREKLASSSPAR